MPRRSPFSFASFDLTVQAPMRSAFASSGDLPQAMQDILDQLSRPLDGSLASRLNELQRISAVEHLRRD